MTTTSSATLLTTSNTDSSQLTAVMSDPGGVDDLPSSSPSPPNCKSSPKGGAEKNPMSLSSSSRDVQEIDSRDRRLVYMSTSQCVLGGVILAWAGAVVSNEASLGGASAAAALIGGIAGLVAGVAGFSSRRRKLLSKSNHSSSVVAVATSAIALAACSLVLALSATGLLRDGNKPASEVTWGALISNVGLLLTSGLLATSCVVAAALWRKDAGLCTSRHRRPHGLQQPLPCTPPVPHKHKLINNWLGQQPPHHALFMISPMSPPSGGSIYGGSIPPHIVPLHMPPPPMGVPPYMLPHPMGPPPPCMLHGATLPLDRRERRVSRHHVRSGGSTHGGGGSEARALTPDLPPVEKDPREEERLTALAAKRQRAIDAFTEQELERSYTGLDRVIAEEFISQTMERHQKSQSASRKSSVGTSNQSQTSAVIEHSRL